MKPEPDDLTHDSTVARRAGTPAVWLATTVLGVALAGLFVIGWLPRHRQQQLARQDAAERADGVPTLAVAAVRESAGAGRVTLPCDVRAEQEALIRTRATGYLKALHADMGDQVEQGKLLAEIDAPEIDSELTRGQAALEQARATLAKATTLFEQAERSLQRYQRLGHGVASEEDVDQKTSARDSASKEVALADANVAYAAAEVNRLTSLRQFGQVTAPFAGRISLRSQDVGALLSPTGSNELFRLVKSDVVRVFVRVPQVYASEVADGAPVVLTVRNEPGTEFPGKITRKAGEFDGATRTMLFEARVPNPDGKLYPGMYGQLAIPLASRQPLLLIPVSALLLQGEGKRVAAVKDGVVHLRAIEIGRDFGNELEVLSGLGKDERVAVSPPAQLTEGDRVKAHEMPPAAPAAKGS